MPKHSVIFRKITELKKCLDACRAGGNSNGNEKSNGKEDHSPTAFADDGAESGANGNHSNNQHDDDGGNDAEWNSLGEEKSKWLRIADFTLQNDEDNYSIDNTDTIVKRDSTVPNIHSNTNNDLSLGLGPRVQQQRPRHAQSGEKTPRGGNWDWWWNGVRPSWNRTFGTGIANVTASGPFRRPCRLARLAPHPSDHRRRPSCPGTSAASSTCPSPPSTAKPEAPRRPICPFCASIPASAT
mmetsp:Transcript_21665/g.43973  ORF Transcript_21665/g.43973 Transcript_21665/m.43973 type:complete len:240 (+) Transcript_21665:649-1368(+)